MAIIPLKAWYLEKYEPIVEVEKRAPTLRLSRGSLMRSAMRADFLNDSQEVRLAEWFQRYLDGDTVEFYIEGSGGYTVANVDLLSHEVYLLKQDNSSQFDPILYLCPQTFYAPGQEALRSQLEAALKDFNGRSRLPLSLITSPGQRTSPYQLRQIRKSLVFIADTTPVANAGERALVDPQVAMELGYALQSKRPEQVLLVAIDRPDCPGHPPFNLPSPQHLTSKLADLPRTLPQALTILLQRYNLFP
jgi:hypothetical protein